jgi:glutaredoxin
VESLEGVSFPLLSDFWPHGEIARQYGVFREHDGRSERALFVVDREGFVRYVDIHDIDDQPDNEEVFQVLRELEPDAVLPEEAAGALPAAMEQPAAMGRPAGAATEQPPVILYCRPGCIDCRLARRFLDRHGVPFTEINVRTTPGAEVQVRGWTGGPLISPVFDIGGRIVIDFNRSELREALGLN